MEMSGICAGHMRGNTVQSVLDVVRWRCECVRHGYMGPLRCLPVSSVCEPACGMGYGNRMQMQTRLHQEQSAADHCAADAVESALQPHTFRAVCIDREHRPTSTT